MLARTQIDPKIRTEYQGKPLLFSFDDPEEFPLRKKYPTGTVTRPVSTLPGKGGIYVQSLWRGPMAQTMEEKRQRVRSSNLICGKEDVEAVRHVLFGVRSDGSGTSADLPDIFDNFNDVVEQFAEDLNTKQFHFLLELLQNCCDNLYDVRGSLQLLRDEISLI